MKILYFGTVCELNHYFEFLEGCKRVPSVASVVFESALLEGFFQNDIEVEVHSYPMIPTYPHCRQIHFGKNYEKLPCGYSNRWLNTLNLPLLKQISRKKDAEKVLKHWLEENAEDGVIMTYSIPPFLIKSILKYAKRYSVKVVPVITDLLRDMYVNEKENRIVKMIKNCYLKPAMKMQDKCDGYVYLTEAMKEVVAPDKPYMVMEGIADINGMCRNKEEKSCPKAVMYAGVLHEKYGILNLLDAFEMLDDKQTELWLFGTGTAEEEVKERAKKNQRIKYFGVIPRENVLEYEKKATLLVNPRDSKETFTKYSFPSKMIEYMLSGTAMLTVRLEGIPKEYYDYVFASEDNSAECLREALYNALQYRNEELENIGKRARQYVIEMKGAKKQTERILHFINDL